MDNRRFAIRSNRVVTSEGTRSCSIVICDGLIEAICEFDEVPNHCEVRDYGNKVIAPGVIDSHIHLNDPGRSSWEGFRTGTQAAAAGGITTLIDMPLNSDPVTIDVPSLEAKRRAAQDQCWVDVGFYGGLVPGNTAELTGLAEQGVLGIKAFLCDSGLPEFPATTRHVLENAMPIIASQNIPLLLHAELTDDSAPRMLDGRSYRQFVASRPGNWELAAIQMMIDLTRIMNTRIHIVHLANAQPEVLELILSAKAEGLPISVETCPHYLFFCEEEIPDGDPRYKCAPPIRSRDNRKCLIQALIQGTIDTLGSDHSPCPAEMKYLAEGDIQSAWGGISGVQFMLPAVWSALREHGVSFEQVFQWLSSVPAKLFGLGERKGRIQSGYDADLIVWAPEESWIVANSEIKHRNGISPYEGHRLYGKVYETFLRGQTSYSDGVLSEAPYGELIKR